MKRKFVSLIVITLMILSILTGCTPNNEQGAPQDKDETSAKSIEITDIEGRQFTIEGDVDRVVVIGSALRLYTYINGTDKLVGVEKAQQSVESARPYIVANPELKDLPLVGEGHPADPDPELIIAVDPDVIIAGDIMDKAHIEALQNKVGVPVVITTCGNTAVFDEDMYKSMRIIGKIVGREERTEEVISFMEDCKKELKQLTSDTPDEQKPSIYVGGLSHKGTHGIESTAGNSPLLNAIGAKNVADEIGKTGSIMIDKEQLIKWDPDMIIIDENGLPIVREDYQKNPDFYNALSAVKNGKVYGQLPYISYYNNIETAMADIYFVGKLLYPEEFKDIDPKVKANEIYNFLLDKPLYEYMSEKFGGFKNLSL